MANVDLNFRIFGQDKSAGAIKKATENIQGLDKATDGARKATDKLKTALAGVAIGAAVATFFKKSITAASDLEQAMGSLEAVFKDNTATMEANAKAASRIGLSQAVYAQQAAVLGAQLGNLGIEESKLAGTTDDLIGVAADMAAQFGGSTYEATEAIASLMRKERDPIERFGVSITDAGVKAEMAATGLSETEATLSLLNKQLERSGTIGAAAREMETFAGSTGRMSASMENAMAQLGGTQLPVMAKLADMVERIAPQIADALTPAFDALGNVALDALEGIEENLPAIQDGIGKFADAMAEVGPAVERNWPQIKDTVESLAGALERVGGFVGFVWEQFQKLPDEVKQLLAMLAIAQKTGVINIAFKGAELVKGMVSNIAAAVVNVSGPVSTGAVGKGGVASKAKYVPLVGAGGAVLGVVGIGAVATGYALHQLLTGQAADNINEQGGNPATQGGTYAMMGNPGERAEATAGQPFVPGSHPRQTQEFREEMDRVKEDHVSWVSALQAVGSAFGAIPDIVRFASEGFSLQWSSFTSSVNTKLTDIKTGIEERAQGMWDGITNAFGTVGEWLGNLPTTIKDTIGDLSGTLTEKGSDLLSGLGNGISSWWTDTVYPWFTGLPQRILDAIPDLGAVLFGDGEDTTDGLLGGITNVWNTQVWPWLAGLPQRILNAIPSLVSTLFSDGQNVVSGFFSGVKTFWSTSVSPWLTGLPSRITNALRGAVNGAFGWISDYVINPINTNVLSKFGAPQIGRLPQYAEGGYVSGPGTGQSDSIAARLSNGEFVVNANATRNNRTLLEAINAGREGYGIGGWTDFIPAPVKAAADWATRLLDRGIEFAVNTLASPLMAAARNLFGGTVGGGMSVGTMGRGINALKSWAKIRDAAVPGGYAGPVQSGNFTKPLSRYSVTSEWLRSGADLRHFGIDLGAPTGTPIYAIAAGKAVPMTSSNIGATGGYGIMATLDHGGGFSTRYAHMSSLAVALGQIVRAGQMIGRVGSTGDSTGPHLHFETRFGPGGGVARNPRSVMAFDSGGFLPPGLSMAYNGTGDPEPVLTSEQWTAMGSAAKNKGTQVDLYIDGRALHESLVRYKRAMGGTSLGLA